MENFELGFKERIAKRRIEAERFICFVIALVLFGMIGIMVIYFVGICF